MSSAVAGYKATLGADAPPACYDDRLQHAATLFIAGSNTAFAHPILFRRIEDAKRRQPGAAHDRGRPAPHRDGRHGRPAPAIQPGTDVALFNGMLHLMLWEGLTDPAFIAGASPPVFESAARPRARLHAPETAATCGIAEADLVQAARWFAGLAPGTRADRAHARLLPGPEPERQRHGQERRADQPAPGHRQIGKVGAGPFSLTGQPNAMGGREVGGLANPLSATATSATRSTAPRCRACGVDEVPAAPARRPSRCSRPRPTARSRRCGSPAPTRPSRCPTRPRAARAAARRVRGVQEASPTPPPGASPTCCCPPRPGPRRTAPSPTASAASAACARPWRPARPAPRLGHRHRGGAPARARLLAGPQPVSPTRPRRVERAPRVDRRRDPTSPA